MSKSIRRGAGLLAGTLITAALALGCSRPGAEAGQGEQATAAEQVPEAARTAAGEAAGEAVSEAATPVAPATPEPAEEAEERTLLSEGAEAPDFTAEAHDGSRIQLGALRGQPVVLYFYPKDETPGCTVEAQAFRDELPALEKLGARVIGVSLDSLASHKAFAENHELSFPLVADTDGKIAASYGVDTSRGFARRVTFVIGADGKIAKVYPRVKVEGHAGEVLAQLQSMK